MDNSSAAGIFTDVKGVSCVELKRGGNMCERVQETEENNEGKLIRYRREFHKYPESGWLTFRTTILTAQALEEAGFTVFAGEEIVNKEQVVDAPDSEQVRQGWERCRREVPEFLLIKWKERMRSLGGVVAVYDSKRIGPTLAYRFDTDALEIEESMDPERIPVREAFVSCHPGCFHGCGHDGHTAVGIVTAMRLMEKKEMISGRLIFIFQPAEEGVRGAKSYCGNWKFGKIDLLLCSHLGFTEKDTMVAGAGGFLATSKTDAEFFGRSAHAGLCPQEGRNALLAAADSMVSMQNITKPDYGTVRLNVGVLKGGEARNTIPAYALLQMETRGSSHQLNQYMKYQAERIMKACAEKYGVTVRFTEKGESQSAVSSRELSRRVQTVVQKNKLYKKCELYQEFGASDDGSVFMKMVQEEGGEAAYLLFGCETLGKQHEKQFDFDEAVLQKCSDILVETGFELMGIS